MARMTGAYRLGGGILFAAGTIALLFGLAHNRHFDVGLLGLASAIVGLVALLSGRGESIGLGLALVGTAIMTYSIVSPQIVVERLTALSRVLHYGLPGLFGAAALVFLLGVLRER